MPRCGACTQRCCTTQQLAAVPPPEICGGRIRRRPIEYQEREIQYVNKCPSIIAAPALYSIHC